MNNKINNTCTVTIDHGTSCTVSDSSGCVAGNYIYVSNYLGVIKSNTEVCEEVTTPGYYKTSDNKYYSIASDGATVAELGTGGDISGVTGCTAGELKAGGSLCVNTETTNAITMNGDGKLFLAVDTSAGLLSGTGDKKIVVKSITNGFEIVSLESTKKYLVIDKGKLLGGDYGEIIVVDNTLAIADGINGSDYCVDKNWNVYDRKTGLCEAVVDEGEEDCTSYYNCSAGKACVVSNANTKRSNDCIPTTTSKCPKGYYLVKDGVIVTNSDADGYLFYCDGENNCVDRKTNANAPLGYLVNASGSGYIVCTSSTACKLATISDSCTSGNYGVLYDTGNKLCIFSGEEKYITTTSASIHIISKSAELFGISLEAGKFIAIEIDSDKNILVVDPTDSVGYYITGESNTAALTSASSSGSLYQCEGATNHLKCSSVTGTNIPNGFLVNAGNGVSGTAPYIECQGATGCKAIAISGTSCAETADEGSNVVTTGALFKQGGSGNIKICIVDKSVEIKSESKGKYFISTDGGLFGLADKADHFMVINIDAVGNITVDKEHVRYRYTNGDTILIESRATASGKTGDGQICGSGANPTEYILDEWDEALTTALGGSNFYYVKEE
ncbi:hypothetical protein LY90DRAFT_512884 [Neocallimastix californiae]|uniref:Uncharacterized protein n=1 Tax=Neocallimastix californiae TaxID=1754190 RepID=A0A1Y2B3U3_9FUNG|nr:hypothetical protein LY90DRAFT_512884 [Neocallimastix californiae]|eukprot:ORY29396.1 hypothetical protein LY90DRAFT_512884 [Neocallimastix californiae]